MGEVKKKNNIHSSLQKVVHFFNRTKGSGLLFCTITDSEMIQNINFHIQKEVLKYGLTIGLLNLTSESGSDFLKAIKEMAVKYPDGMIISYFDRLISQTKGTAIQELNNTREVLINLHVPLVFWFQNKNLSLLSNKAPDFFLRRDRSIIKFPKTQEMLGEMAEIKEAIKQQKKMKKMIPDNLFNVTLSALQIQFDEIKGLVESLYGKSDKKVIAQSGGVAVGGDIRGSTIITGDHNIVGNVYQGSLVKDDAEALEIYRQVLVNSLQYLPMRGIELGASDPQSARKRMHLVNVYVQLETTTTEIELKAKDKQDEKMAARRTEKANILKALKAVTYHKHVVMLGDPGSGKSTFINHLTFCLAANGLDPKGEWMKYIPDWPKKESNLLPILVTLRDFGYRIPQDQEPAEPNHIWEFIRSRLKAQNVLFAETCLERMLQQGKAVILLDGLDEIQTVQKRIFVRDAITAFKERYPDSRMVVTCRVLSYQDKKWQLPNFHVFELAHFRGELIRTFIKGWYHELVRLGEVRAEDEKDLTEHLIQAIQRRDIRRLAPIPLLLTVMALVHTHKGQLPEARAVLYEDTVDLLLFRWDELKAGGERGVPQLRALLTEANRTNVDLKITLSRLAFEAHKETDAGEEAVADIKEWQLEKAFARLHPKESRDWAHRMINTIKLRAGLLIERQPGVYSFPHRTFQEYLAGSYLSNQNDFSKQAVELSAKGAFWREVILLAVGKLVFVVGDTDKPLALVNKLCPKTIKDSDRTWKHVWLAGTILVEAGVNRMCDKDLGQDLVHCVTERLQQLVEKGRLHVAERNAAANDLARLGDPRKGVLLNKNGLPDIDWVTIKAGVFTMGSQENDPDAYDDQKPQLQFKIDYDYQISRYPVTVAQYEAFVKDGGYQKDKYWTDAGLSWKGKNNIAGPETYSEVFQLPNHPQVGVSWYEAFAFCNWLSEKLNQNITLPSEPQWECAARHTDGRKYPWGDAENVKERCNMYNTGLGSTSAVGIFPEGHAVCGASELSGNVWEWCRTKRLKSYDDYEKKLKAADDPEGDSTRVLRGGSFVLDPRDCRCACRGWDLPDVRHYRVGFRLIQPL